MVNSKNLNTKTKIESTHQLNLLLTKLKNTHKITSTNKNKYSTKLSKDEVLKLIEILKNDNFIKSKLNKNLKKVLQKLQILGKSTNKLKLNTANLIIGHLIKNKITINNLNNKHISLLKPFGIYDALLKKQIRKKLEKMLKAKSKNFKRIHSNPYIIEFLKIFLKELNNKDSSFQEIVSKISTGESMKHFQEMFAKKLETSNDTGKEKESEIINIFYFFIILFEIALIAKYLKIKLTPLNQIVIYNSITNANANKKNVIENYIKYKKNIINNQRRNFLLIDAAKYLKNKSSNSLAQILRFIAVDNIKIIKNSQNSKNITGFQSRETNTNFKYNNSVLVVKKQVGTHNFTISYDVTQFVDELFKFKNSSARFLPKLF